jgi:hypothetical protein
MVARIKTMNRILMKRTKYHRRSERFFPFEGKWEELR